MCKLQRQSSSWGWPGEIVRELHISVAMMVSALHIHGIDHIGRVLADLRYWLEKHEYASLSEMRGCLSRRYAPDTSPYDRRNYIKTLSSYNLRQTMTAF